MLWATAYPVVKAGKDSVWQLGNVRQANNSTDLELFLEKHNRSGEYKYVGIYTEKGLKIYSVQSGGALKLEAE
ncbi:MAG: hypothetical protein MCSN_2270 [Candidatus Microsyncoccus archaeolyticus]|jgi:hypothetical protein|nr:MAG: hypothetical protein MCSN_2270 [Candidatus Parcubacteria bacterium]